MIHKLETFVNFPIHDFDLNKYVEEIQRLEEEYMEAEQILGRISMTQRWSGS